MKNINLLFTFLLLLLSSVSIAQSGQHQVNPENKTTQLNLEFEEILHGWSSSYLDKITIEHTDTLSFHLKDTDDYWYVIFNNGKYMIRKGTNENAKIIITSSLNNYSIVYNGKMTPLTAFARASLREPAPIDMIFRNGMQFKDMDWAHSYGLLLNFFNPHPHNKLNFGHSYSRVIHGGNVAGLYYSVGFRSGYFNIQKGDTLNRKGEKDPFHQSFIIIEGEGYMLLDNDTLKVKKGEAYYIKPEIIHKVWSGTEEGIGLIWNAWGTTW